MNCNKSDAMSLIHQIWPNSKTSPTIIAALAGSIASLRLEFAQVKSAMTAHALEDRFAQTSPVTAKLLERLRNLRYVKEVDKTANHSMKWSRPEILRHRWKSSPSVTDAELIATELRMYYAAFPPKPVEQMTGEEQTTMVMAYAGPVADAGLNWESAIEWACELTGVDSIQATRKSRMEADIERPRVRKMLALFGKSERVKPGSNAAILRESEAVGHVDPIDIPWDNDGGVQ